MTDENQGKDQKVAEKGSLEDESGDREGPEAEKASTESMPGMDFVTFVISLYHSSSCHLGISPNPETKTCEENLPLAKETIDILGMLQQKTQGNLTGEEERILSEVLYDLRMAYIQAVNKP